MLEALTQESPFLTVIIGNFNEFNEWYSTNDRTSEEAKPDNLTSQNGLTQISKKPAYISDNYRSLNYNQNEKIFVLTKTVLNIMSIFILNENVLACERDSPWITSKFN